MSSIVEYEKILYKIRVDIEAIKRELNDIVHGDMYEQMYEMMR